MLELNHNEEQIMAIFWTQGELLIRDILDQMDFVPKMDGEPKLMDARIFTDELMGLKK